jgi:hypothetical protein
LASVPIRNGKVKENPAGQVRHRLENHGYPVPVAGRRS